jgi:hypothetical protein
MSDIREFLRANISTIVATADLHDATIGDDDTYVCPAPCTFTGTSAEWEQHLADVIAEKLEPVGELTLL